MSDSAGAGAAPAGVRRNVVLLGTAQTLAWGSSFYLPAVLAAPMARDLGVATPTVFAAFSLALLVSALVGPASGRFIDRHGGRGLLIGTNVLFALGLAALALARGPITLALAWVLLGLAMGSGLYEAAFATLVRLYGAGSRNPITGITLIAGFASTVGWPLSAWMSELWGWRGACFGWAALHLLLGVPLNALLPKAPAAPPAVPANTERAAEAAGTGPPPSGPNTAPLRSALFTLVLLSFAFATTRFVSTAIGAHLPGLLMALGATLAAAVAAGALIGPAQVGGRLLEFGLLRKLHPLLSARLAALGHPIGAALLLVLGAPAAALFALLHGAGNGILTIAKGTLPLALFGPQGYGARQGWLSMPSLLLQPLAPWVYGLVIERSPQAALWLSTALVGSACVALLLLRMPRG